MVNEDNSSIKLGASQVLHFRQPLTQPEALTRMAASLQQLGYVKESFCQAVFEREKVFPTGLPTDPIGVAIPHTDAEHVNSNAIAIGILAEPVQFEEMGTSEGASFLDVSLITMLAISTPGEIITLLGQLARCYQDGAFLQKIHSEENVQRIMDLFQEKVPQIVIVD